MKIVVKNKILDISDVESFVHKMYGEGWIHESSISTNRGEIRTFVDKDNIYYNILYEKNVHNVYIPKEITQIRIY